MRIAIPKEVKQQEGRVAITPAGVFELVTNGHEVFVETAAGAGSSYADEEYESSGATILPDAAATWAAAEMILKVKEPIDSEYDLMQDEQVLFTYLHVAADRPLTEQLLERRITAIAYEAVQTPQGDLPLLAPMSEVAGRIATQAGAHYLTASGGGRGLVLGGVPGVPSARVVVLGAGIAGMNAAEIAVGMGADVTLMDKRVEPLRAAERSYEGRLRTLVANAQSLEEEVLRADMVIGAVLVPGARAAKLIPNELVARMLPGSVLVDISIDQGGCFEDSRPTTHDEPTFRVHESVFYCVANIPAIVPRTSTKALTNVTLPYAVALANLGWRQALAADPTLAAGLTTAGGRLTSRPVAEAHQLDFVSIEEALAS